MTTLHPVSLRQRARRVARGLAADALAALAFLLILIALWVH